MNPIDLLREEHRAVLTVSDALSAMCDMLSAGTNVDPEHFERAISFIKTYADKSHHFKEEEVLFPLMEKAGVAKDKMLADSITTEHDLGRGYVRGMTEALVSYSMGDMDAAHPICENVRRYVRLIKSHIAKEEEIIFPLAESELSAEHKERLAREFERINEELGGERHDEMIGILDLLKERYLAAGRS